jgi:hypothetical protein
MKKYFSVNGVLKEIKREPGGIVSVENYIPPKKHIVQILVNNKLTDKLLKVTEILDADIGVCDTTYTENIKGG